MASRATNKRKPSTASTASTAARKVASPGQPAAGSATAQDQAHSQPQLQAAGRAQLSTKAEHKAAQQKPPEHKATQRKATQHKTVNHKAKGKDAAKSAGKGAGRSTGKNGNKSRNKGGDNGTGEGHAASAASAASASSTFSSPKARSASNSRTADYTGAVLRFLKSAHGRTRVDEQGDYYYVNVSTTSLHFLLNSDLPGPAVLWEWYQFFDQERSESIYQTIAPLDDEQLLSILERAAFAWDAVAVRGSGLVFLKEHQTLVYRMLEEFLEQRLEDYQVLSDDELRKALRPGETWSEQHLQHLVQQIQTVPLTLFQRGKIYEQLESGYLRATARQLLDQAIKESFWKNPPLELEDFGLNLITFVRHMIAESRRLGVFVSRAAFVQRAREQGWAHFRGRFRNGRRQGIDHPRGLRELHFTTLGLDAGASLNEVKSAYREMVKHHHPDQGGTVQDFIQLQEAYEYLLTKVF